MHSSYITSTISLRSKGSLSFSVSDYTCFVDDRFDRNPISFSPSSCCSCCANSTNRVPINPTFLYGLRQSTLIQWSPSRRLILGGVNQCYSRFPVCDIDPNCYYQKSYSFKERGTSARRGRWRKGNYGRTVLEERGKRRNLCEANDAEVILSLLTEEVGEKCLGVRERNGRSSRRVQVEKRGNRTKKNNVGSGGLESNSKCEHQAVEFQSREEDNRRKEDRRKEEREFLSGGEGLRARKEGSSCSSYYSFSTLGESESDSEVQVKRDEFVGESSSEYKTDRKGTGEIRYDGEFQEEIERDAGDAVEHGVSLEKKNTAKGLYSASSGIECDWRKKSEKKLAEVSVEQAEARKESSQKLFRSSEVNRSGYDSNARKQNNYRDEKSTLAVSTDKGTRQKYSQIGDKISGQSESRMKYNQLRETEQIHSSVIKTSSNSEKQYRGREDYKSGDRITRQDEYDGSTQQLAEVSEIQETDNRGTSTSQRQSETCTDDAEHRQADRRVTRKMNSRGKSQQLTKISDTHDVDVESKIISQRRSETRMKKQEEAFISYPQAKEQRSQMDAKAIRRLESRKESHDVTNDGDAENVTKSVSGKRVSSQEKYLTSVEKSVEETRERQHLTDERVSRIRSRKEAQMPTKVLSLSEGMSDKASSSQASLKLNPQLKVQQITLDEGDKKSSQATMTPPSSATVAGVAVQVERTSGSASRKFSSERLGSGSSISHAQTQTSSPDSQLEIYGGARRDESHGEPLNFISHEDALSSADKSQKFSSHFVDEFVEKVRHEVSTSEVQKVKKTSETKLVHEREQYKQKGHQYGSRDSQPKDRDSRRSSRSSGAKGPSDEMWDVNNPSITIEEPPETEAPEAATTTGKDIVRGSGRSMWGIISDIVRMRWASRSESHNSRSGRRSSPNQSTSSEAWFSGHEHDENVGDTVKKERSSVPQSVDQQQGVIHAQSQGEVSSLISSTDKIKHVGVDSQSLSNTESELASKGNSSSSIEETYAEHLEGNSGTAISKPTFPLPAIRMRRSPGVQEISGGTTDASGSGTMVQMTEVSGTEGKDGEVKRRKLQRNKQVPKDRFDEWEEAFTLETEQRKIDEMFMKEALLEAKKAGDMWEVPVGAVLVQHGKIIARGYNLVEELRDSTAHAEMICIREASNILQSWRLSETTLYVTLEPCPMCAGAILQARVDTVVWGAPNKLLGADGSWIRLFPNGSEEGTSTEPTDKPAAPVHPFHPKMKIRRGVLATECADVMTEFFQLRRRKKEKKTEPPTPPSCLPVSNHPSKFFTKMHDAFNIMFCL